MQTETEYASLKCQNGTSNERGGDRRALPYAFTQQGIGMLSGILRSQIAIETNIKIMRAFVGMQRYIAASMQIFQRLNSIELQQLENKQWRKETENKISSLHDVMTLRASSGLHAGQRPAGLGSNVMLP